MNSTCRVREFAKLAGVTVRALHHYEQVGLLKPARTNAGYRAYSRADLERLEQIVALKFLGLPLQQIRALLDRNPLQLSEALQVQLAILHEKRQLLDRAIQVIGEVVVTARAGKPVEITDLKRIIGEITMQENTDFMQKYFSKEAWTKLKGFKKQSTPETTLRQSKAWLDLLCEIEDARGEDYASKKVQALAMRWMDHVEKMSQGDANIQAGWKNAWLDRKHWPGREKDRLASYDLEKISQFMVEAIRVSVNLTFKKYYNAKAWKKLSALQKRSEHERKEIGQKFVELYREMTASLSQDPRSEKAQRLAIRWLDLLDLESGGDPDVKAGMMKAIADRKSWPLWLKRHMAARCQLSIETYNDVANFIERALSSRQKFNRSSS